MKCDLILVGSFGGYIGRGGGYEGRLRVVMRGNIKVMGLYVGSERVWVTKMGVMGVVKLLGV